MADEKPINYISLAHLHVIVDNIDEAADFYRNVLGFIEMQSHENIINKGLATYYGFAEEPEKLLINFRFLFLPEVITIKLVKLIYKDYDKPSGYVQTLATGNKPDYATVSQYGKSAPQPRGIGPISIVVADLDGAYDRLVRLARDYSSKYKFRLVSSPTFLSPLLPHEIGATRESALYGQQEVLQAIADSWPLRAKFHLIDPFGLQWEFNNNVDHRNLDRPDRAAEL